MTEIPQIFQPTEAQKEHAAVLDAYVTYDDEDDPRGPAVARAVPLEEAPMVAEAMIFFGLYVDSIAIFDRDGVRYVTYRTRGYRWHDQNPEGTSRPLCRDARDSRYLASVNR